MRRPRVLVTHHQVQQVALELLREECDVLVPSMDFPARAEILDLCSGIDGLLWTNYKMKLDREVLDACGPQLQAVSLTMNGVDCVDTEELRRRNIALGHTPAIPNEAVADLAIGLMIAANGGLLRSPVDSTSPKESLPYHSIQGCTVGIIGFGGIGQLIAKRLQGFDIGKIVYCGRSIKEDADKFNAHYVSQQDLFKQADILFISCPLLTETCQMFNRDTFLAMKKTAVLINIARGAIIDKDALIDALKCGHIRAAGLDTVTVEPLPPDSELFRLPNCVVIPHLGTATKRTRDGMAVRAVENLVRGLRSQKMISQFQ